MKHLITLSALALSFTIGTASQAATIYSIDINDANNSVTEPGWTGLDATNSGDGGTVNVGGIDFTISSSIGARLRGTVGSPSPNALTGDFAFDGGNANPNGAVILLFGGAGSLAAGTWQVEVWSHDADFTVGDQILGLRTNTNENNPATINGVPQANGRVTDTMGTSAIGPAATFTFLSNGTSAYDVFVRENNSNSNRTRLNAVRLTLIPEPSATAVLGVLSAALLIRRRR